MIEDLIRRYYDAFNRADFSAMAALVDDEVVHDVNQGRREVGRAAFETFLASMDDAYVERIDDLVVFTEPSGRRAAAEFVVHGEYRRTQAGLPPATGQSYRLPVGAFFEARDGRITRVTNYYNLQDWLNQVS
ncbi:MAG: nuclear transport factor 2 family protein [Planctomycetes bacterium]|nr:nuclear transport factor 2 family protein [Planctomycetota bacterium]